MRIVTIIGARPQFIKAAAVSRILRKEMQEVLIHTGQHYDYNMSDIFFDELDIPKPDYNLGISGGSHGEMTGAMLSAIEKNLVQEKPDAVLDPMYDAFTYYGDKLTDENRNNMVDFDGNAVIQPNEFYYLTCHRQENTDTDSTLLEIFKAMNSLDAPTIYPVHPRNHDRAKRLCETNNFQNIFLIQPVGYLTSIALVKDAKKVVTDSGGLQREAFFAGTQCIFIFPYVAWPETMVGNRNQLASPDKDDILSKLAVEQTIDASYQPFGDGYAGTKITEYLLKKFKS